MIDEEIHRKYADDLVRFATGLVGPFDAQDVVTDACLRTFCPQRWPEVTARPIGSRSASTAP
jgi:DNA-directed RNA polymerase specialized sigma24 family protein